MTDAENEYRRGYYYVRCDKCNRREKRHDPRCDFCGNELERDFPEQGNYVGALEIKLAGGYSMYYDGASIEVLICGQCAAVLMDNFPVLKELMVEAEDAGSWNEET